MRETVNWPATHWRLVAILVALVAILAGLLAVAAAAQGIEVSNWPAHRAA